MSYPKLWVKMSYVSSTAHQLLAIWQGLEHHAEYGSTSIETSKKLETGAKIVTSVLRRRVTMKTNELLWDKTNLVLQWAAGN